MRKRVSRSLWDNARNPNTPNRILALFKAILYELQPIDVMHSNIEFQNVKAWIKQMVLIVLQAKDWIPSLVRHIREQPLRHWMLPSILFLYWKLVVYVHEKLDAGPFMLILTALVIIFTIGLGDHGQEDHINGGERMSAYSVFNRGFRNILGGVDATALLHQHVGGGFLAGAHMPMNNDDDRLHHQAGPMVHRRQQQQQQQQQRQQQVGQAQLQQEEGEPENHNGRGQRQEDMQKSRKSNKKNRRKKNIELRREMQRQRDAAAAMGFVGGDHEGNGHWDVVVRDREQVAMNRLVEDQVIQAGGDAADYMEEEHNDE